jgi:hypothetical protein
MTRSIVVYKKDNKTYTYAPICTIEVDETTEYEVDLVNSKGNADDIMHVEGKQVV